jgi:hypothetical protein
MKSLRDAIDVMLQKQDEYRRAQQKCTQARRDYRECEDVVRQLRGKAAASRPRDRRQGRAA